MVNNRRNEEVKFNIIENIGALNEYATGWTKELNIFAWNEGAPKYDIRDWSPEHDHMSRGITLFEEEARNLMNLLSEKLGGDTAEAVSESESA